MNGKRTTQGERAQVAAEALAGLDAGQGPLLRIGCGASHHLAQVHRTDSGLVFHSWLRSHGHGRRDFVDGGHSAGSARRDWFDLLDVGTGPEVDDALPAWCDCGQRLLSRAAVLDWVAAGERRVVVT